MSTPHGPNDVIQRIGWPIAATFCHEDGITIARTEGASWVYEGITPDGPLWTLLDEFFQPATVEPDAGKITITLPGTWRR